MLKTLVVALFAAAFVVPAFAQDDMKADKGAMKTELHGYIVDAMCAGGMMKKDDPMAQAAKHTKGCALEEACAESGYGVFSDGKYYKFDKAGDTMALALIKKSDTKAGMMVHVEGVMMDDVLKVVSIQEHVEE